MESNNQGSSVALPCCPSPCLGVGIKLRVGKNQYRVIIQYFESSIMSRLMGEIYGGIK